MLRKNGLIEGEKKGREGNRQAEADGKDIQGLHLNRLAVKRKNIPGRGNDRGVKNKLLEGKNNIPGCERLAVKPQHVTPQMKNPIQSPGTNLPGFRQSGLDSACQRIKPRQALKH